MKWAAAGALSCCIATSALALVALLSVRVLVLSAKHLILAAKQLFLAAKHAVACMSLPRGRFQRELSARQPGYTLWTMIQ